MKTNEEIDKLFREETQRNYPYDENLWSQAEKELPAVNTSSHSKWRNVFKFLFALVLILFLKTDSIVSLNQSNPKETKEKSDLNSMANWPNQLAIIDQERTISKKNILAKESQTRKRKVSQVSKVEETKRENLSKKEHENTLVKGNSSSEKTATTEKYKLSKFAEKLNTTEMDHLKSSKIAHHSVPDFSSHSHEKSVILKTSDLSKIHSLGFLIETNYAQALPKSKERSNLNKLQQKFKRRTYFMELEYGHSILLNKQLSELEGDLREYRKEAENSRSMQSVGLNFLTDINQFTLGFGIHLSSYHEQLNYSYDEEVNNIRISYDTSYSVIDDNFNSNGNPVILIRENINENRTEVTENVNRELVLNNYFKRISIPLSIGYTKTFGRFNAGFRTAVVLNYLYEYSGGYIGNNRDHFYSFEKKNQLQDWVIGNRNQLRLGYSLNEFVVIGTSLNHEQDLSSFTQSYSSKFNTYGLGFWLLYNPR